MRFLWMSNAPWVATGYGSQTKLILKALDHLGHEPSCFAFYGLNGGPVEYDGYTVYPNSNFEAWGNDVVAAHIERSESAAVITLMDLFVLQPGNWSKLKVPWLAWVPIDSEGIGGDNLRMLELCNMPIAMSKFGAEQMMKHDIEPGAMIYHTVDTDVFTPLDKDECRDFLDIPSDVYLIGMVMANKGDRKQYPQQLCAIKQFMDENPDLKVRVYLHTEPTAIMGGWDMRELVELLGLKGKVYSTNQYQTSIMPVDQSMMAKIYNACDVVLNCTAGEGFGIPIIEAQACGTPVVTADVTAMPELTINGYCVPPSFKALGGHLGWQFGAKVEDITYALSCVYRMCDSKTAALGRQWVVDNCSIPVISASWIAALDFMQESMDAETARKGTLKSRTIELPKAGEDVNILELGSGANPNPSALVHHDRIAHAEYIDIAHDLNEVPWPWDDSSWDRIIAVDVMEHLDLQIQNWLDECWRILVDGGWLELRLPSWENPLSYRDPTHRRVFHEETFFYWQPGHDLFQDFGRYYFAESNKWWEVASVSSQANDIKFLLKKLPSD